MSHKLAVASLFAAAVLVPSLVFAQTTSTGLLHVYVQVLNQNGFSYAPGNFTVSVSGLNPSPSSFAGSQSGTIVSMGSGSYSVTVPNTLNYTPTYSVGCNGTVSAGTTQTCVVTLSPNYNYYTSTSVVAPYSVQQPLSCRTETPTVGLGQTARFTALGGVGGTYNWMTASQNYPNVGPALNTTFMTSGTQTVSVTNAAQTATCVVTVTTSYVPQPQTNVFYGTGVSVSTYGNTPYPQPTLTLRAYPRFPNTGLEPITSAQIAFALVALIGAAIMSYPYARKAFALAVR